MRGTRAVVPRLGESEEIPHRPNNSLASKVNRLDCDAGRVHFRDALFQVDELGRQRPLVSGRGLGIETLVRHAIFAIETLSVFRDGSR